MHPMAPTLTTMVVSATLAARHAARLPVDPDELERYAQRILGRRWLWRPRRFAWWLDPH